jgi:hypothetical protein
LGCQVRVFPGVEHIHSAVEHRNSPLTGLDRGGVRLRRRRGPGRSRWLRQIGRYRTTDNRRPLGHTPLVCGCPPWPPSVRPAW